MQLKSVYIFISLLFIVKSAQTSILDYIPLKTTWFTNTQTDKENQDLSLKNVPYELEIVDEQFIEQAAQLTGIVLSGLDKCQHRVIFKLKEECHKLNDEQLAKLAVKLLNCQSAIEGRKIYPCSDQMSIRDCTSSMDSDTWNSYLLMSNRARAVCYSIRQTQFRGLTEMAVNKLMGAAHEQLDIMSRLKEGQSKLEQANVDTIHTVIQGNEALKQQQSDIRQAQLYGQLSLENNIKRLADEKQLILEGHEQLTQMTKDVKAKLDEAAIQLDDQSEERKQNHKEILNDLIEIQKQAQAIFARIEDSSNHMLEQSALAAKQYEATLLQLAQVNSTVYALVDVVTTTRVALEEKLKWLSEALGGTDDAVERLYIFLTHITYLVLAMVSSAFLHVTVAPRIALLLLVPLNLIVSIQQGSTNALSFIGMTTTLFTFAAVQMLFTFTLNLWQKRLTKKEALLYKTEPKPETETNEAVSKEETIRETEHTDSSNNSSNNTYSAVNTSQSYRDKYSYRSDPTETESFYHFVSPTPPLSRRGYSRSRSNTPQLLNGDKRQKCCATTRMGTPCKLLAVTGRDYCYRHQTGSSVIE